MYPDEPCQRLVPLKGQLPLFTKGVDHLRIQPKFCLAHTLDHFTYFGRAIEVYVLHIKTQDDIECVREWIDEIYAPSETMPYLFTNEYWVFWKSSETKSFYCNNLGQIIADMQEDLDDLRGLIKK
jgi:hypothetical protein